MPLRRCLERSAGTAAVLVDGPSQRPLAAGLPEGWLRPEDWQRGAPSLPERGAFTLASSGRGRKLGSKVVVKLARAGL